MRSITLSFALLLLLFLYSCNSNNPDQSAQTQSVTPPPIPSLNYAVVKTFPHDTTLFTEGLLVHEGKLFESTGSPDGFRTLIGTLDSTTGKLGIKAELDGKKYFGEGIVILKGKVYQLTYVNQLCFVYDASTFKPVGQFKFANKEGWGLTTNGSEIIMSDGTDQLTFINPENFTPVRQVTVTENGISTKYVNELEYINGFIYANIYRKDHIVKIDPSNGNIVARIDMSALCHEARTKQHNADVLNGIAWDSVSDKIYITGKVWPNYYEVQFPH